MYRVVNDASDGFLNLREAPSAKSAVLARIFAGTGGIRLARIAYLTGQRFGGKSRSVLTPGGLVNSTLNQKARRFETGTQFSAEVESAGVYRNNGLTVRYCVTLFPIEGKVPSNLAVWLTCRITSLSVPGIQPSDVQELLDRSFSGHGSVVPTPIQLRLKPVRR